MLNFDLLRSFYRLMLPSCCSWRFYLPDYSIFSGQMQGIGIRGPAHLLEGCLPSGCVELRHIVSSSNACFHLADARCLSAVSVGELV